MFTRRRFKRKARRKSWGGTLKFATKYPGGMRVTQYPIAQTYFTKHEFYDTQHISGGAFELDVYQPTALFNMDLVGGDAAWAAQFVGFWNSYVVLGVKYVITVASRETQDTLLFSVVPWGRIADPISQDDMQYRAGCKTVVLSGQGGTGSTKTISGYVSWTALSGVKVVNEDIFWGKLTVDPTSNMSLYVSTNNSNGSNTTYTLRVHLVAYTKWFNRTEEGNPVPVSALSRLETIVQLRKQAELLENVSPKRKRGASGRRLKPGKVEIELEEEEVKMFVDG